MFDDPDSGRKGQNEGRRKRKDEDEDGGDGNKKGRNSDGGTGTPTDPPPIGINNNRRVDQSGRAQTLLRHMTKGTQILSMFSDAEALVGYARHKFHERAWLLCRSLLRLRPRPRPPGIEGGMMAEQTRAMDEAWGRLLTARSVCSLGCGPGNDAVGLLALLSCLRGRSRNTVGQSGGGGEREGCGGGRPPPSLPDVDLMDFAMSEWEGAVISTLRPALIQRGLAGRIRSLRCDVTEPFESDLNARVMTMPRGGERGEGGNDEDGAETTDVDLRGKDCDEALSSPEADVSLSPPSPRAYSSCSSSSSPNRLLPYDVYLTSYLLTETRGRWENFVTGLVGAAKSGSIFYFAEPAPWQLHRLVAMFGGGEGDEKIAASQGESASGGRGIACRPRSSLPPLLTFLWLDSSMHRPSLQPLDGRVGPAVILAIKR